MGGRHDGSNGPQVPQLGLDHAVDLLGEVRLTGLGRSSDDVGRRLGAADDRGTGDLDARAVACYALLLKELELKVEDPADVGRGQGGGDVVGDVVDDVVGRLVGIEDGLAGF